MTTLEEILQQFFHCKKPFLKTPKKIDGGEYTEYFTRSGAKAYEKLTVLLEKLEGIGVIKNAGLAIEEINNIVQQDN